jgi:hypothetical protein
MHLNPERRIDFAILVFTGIVSKRAVPEGRSLSFELLLGSSSRAG